LLANKRALVDEYGEEHIKAMFKELKSLTDAALDARTEYLAQDENDE
jgi:hypothetical protein